MHTRFSIAAIACLALAACGDSATSTSSMAGSGSGGGAASTATSTSTTTTTDATSTSTSAGGAGGGATSTSSSAGGGPAVDRGPTSIPLDGDPDGLYWDADAATLFIADNDNNRILQYKDGAGTSLFAALPSVSGDNGAGLGAIVRNTDGSLLVPRFGFGTEGAVVILSKDGKTSSLVPNLDVERRRIGITIGSDGSIYDTYFRQDETNTQLGVVAKLDLTGKEVELSTGFNKPVGVLAHGTSVLVSDQVVGKIYSIDPAKPASPALCATLTGPDLLCDGPAGSIFSGGKNGIVRRIDSSGHTSNFAQGFHEVRGVAYDAANKRLFFADHVPGGGQNKLEIMPVDQ